MADEEVRAHGNHDQSEKYLILNLGLFRVQPQKTYEGVSGSAVDEIG